MKTAVAFLTKSPQENTLRFAKEVSAVGFDTFIISDDETDAENAVYIKDEVCASLNYKNAHIWENSGSIQSKSQLGTK